MNEYLIRQHSPQRVNLALSFFCPSPSQNLNRYTPLPPPPHQSHVTALDFGQSPVPDPIFDNLSAEDRAFVANIAAMGFPRSRTARAVQQLGHDDRIVSGGELFDKPLAIAKCFV